MHDETTSRPADDDGSTERSVDPAEQDLRATAESIRSDSRRLASLEEEKLALDPEDDRVDRLSAEAIELADRIHRETRAQRQLSDELG
jgi:hypothetical protein